MSRVPCSITCMLFLVAVSACADFSSLDAPSSEVVDDSRGPVSLVVRVLDENGDPAPAAKVVGYHFRGWAGMEDHVLGEKMTDSEGMAIFEKAFEWGAALPEEPRRYLTPSLPNAEESAMVLARLGDDRLGMARARKSECRDGELNVTVRVEPCVRRDLRVVDVESKPLCGVRVYLYMGAEVQLYEDVGLCSGVTDEMGFVSVLAPEDSAFWAEKDGYAREELYDIVELYPNSEFSGTVVYDDGSPASGAAVWLHQERKEVLWRAGTIADDDGRFVFPNAPVNSVRDPATQAVVKNLGEVIVYAHDMREGSSLQTSVMSLMLECGEKESVKLTLKRPCKISGRVLCMDSNRPVEGLSISLGFETPSRQGSHATCVTDPKGYFEAEVPPDTTVYAMSKESEDEDRVLDNEWRNQNPCLFREHITEDRKDLKCFVKTRRIRNVRGRVTDSNGAPLVGAIVYGLGVERGELTDGDGSFRIPASLTDSDYELFVVGPVDTPTPGGREMAFVACEAGDQRVSITTSPASRMDGIFVDDSGEPAAGLQFRICPWINGARLDHLLEYFVVDESGRFTIDSICPGAPYFLYRHEDMKICFDKGREIVEFSKEDLEKPVRLVAVRKNKTIKGRAVNEDGQPVTDAVLRVESPDTRPSWREFSPYHTDDKGQFCVRDLAAGKSTLSVGAPGYNSMLMDTDVGRDDLEIVLRSADKPAMYKITIVDEEGKPIPAAPVYLYNSSADKTRGYRTDAFADANGTVRSMWSELYRPMGHGMFACRVEGYTHAYAPLTENEDLDITLMIRKNARPWKARVAGSKEDPVPGFELSVRYFEQRGHRECLLDLVFDNKYSYVTDEEGWVVIPEFSRQDSLTLMAFESGDSEPHFAGLNALHHIETFGQTFGQGQLQVSMRGSGSDLDGEAHIVVDAGGTIKGRILMLGSEEPVPGLPLLLDSGIRGKRFFRTDEQGRFTLRNVDAGSHNIWGGKENEDGSQPLYTLTEGINVEVLRGEVSEVSGHAAKCIMVRGKVVDASDGGPPKRNVIVVLDTGSDMPNCGVCDQEGVWFCHGYPGTLSLVVMNTTAERIFKRFDSIVISDDQAQQEELTLEVDFDCE